MYLLDLICLAWLLSFSPTNSYMCIHVQVGSTCSSSSHSAMPGFSTQTLRIHIQVIKLVFSFALWANSLDPPSRSRRLPIRSNLAASDFNRFALSMYARGLWSHFFLFRGLKATDMKPSRRSANSMPKHSPVIPNTLLLPLQQKVRLCERFLNCCQPFPFLRPMLKYKPNNSERRWSFSVN